MQLALRPGRAAGSGVKLARARLIGLAEQLHPGLARGLAAFAQIIWAAAGEDIEFYIASRNILLNSWNYATAPRRRTADTTLATEFSLRHRRKQ